jgi:hypothetical protein
VYVLRQNCRAAGWRWDTKITSYLEQFGYLESNGSLLTETSLTSASHTNEALIRFQEFYNLPTDGTLNQETLAFISKPRCGVKDNPTASLESSLSKME